MRKIPAVILILALVIPLLLATLTLFSVSTWVLKRSFYHELLGDPRLYDALLTEARARRDRPWGGLDWEAPRAFAGVPGEALTKALAETVDGGYLRDQALRAVDAVFDVLDGVEPQAEFKLDLRPLKARLRGEARDRFARTLAESLPVCTSGQDPLVTGSGLLRCRPTGMSTERAFERILAAMPTALDRLPDSYPFAPETVNLFTDLSAYSWAGSLGTARLVLAASILGLVAAGFWVGAAFLGGRDRREVMAFLGWSLLVPAALTLASGLAVRFVFLGRWFMIPALADVARTVLNSLSRGFLVAGGIAAGLALALIAGARASEPTR